MHRFYSLLCGLLMAWPVWGEWPVVALPGEVDASSLQMLVLTDVDLLANIDRLEQFDWQSVDASVEHRFRGGNVWFKFRLRISDASIFPLMLTNRNFFSTNTTAYVLDGNKIVQQARFDASKNIDERLIPYTFPLLHLNIEPGREYSVLLHTTDITPRGVLLGLTVESERQLVHRDIPSQTARSTLLASLLLWSGLFAAIMLLVRFRQELLYAIVFLIASTGTLLLWHGTWYPLFGWGHTWWHTQGSAVFLFCGLGAALLYLRLRLGFTVGWQKIYIQVSSVALFFISVLIAFSDTLGKEPIGYLFFAVYVNALILMIGLTVVAIKRAVSSPWQERCFALVWTVFTFFVLCRFARAFYPDFYMGISRDWSLSMAMLSLWLLFEYFWDMFHEELAKRQQRLLADSKIDMVNRLSHEIRTPLNAVIGLSDLLQADKNSPSAERYVEMIHGAGKTLLGLVNDILDFSKLGSSEMVLQHEPFRLDVLMGEAYSHFLPQCIEKNIQVKGLIDPEINCFFMGDELRLRQVLLNLEGNAIKFLPEGGLLEVYADEIAGKDGKVGLRFQVKDNGRGLPEDKLESIFEPFAQANAEDSSHHKGAGLGLAITKLIVESMGGRIWVESTLGEGSSFFFEIYLEQDPSAPDLKEAFKLFRGKKAALISDVENVGGQVISRFSYYGADMEQYHTIEAFLKAGLQCDFLLIETGVAFKEGHASLLKNELAGTPILILESKGEAWPETLLSENLRIIKMPAISIDMMCAALELLTGKTLFLDKKEESTGATWETDNHKVLVVDDNSLNLLVCGKLLESLSVEHVTMDNGREAVEAIKSGRFSLLLLDCEMPDMDGFATARAIRQWEQENQKPALPIVALTAHTLTEVTTQCLDAGMDNVIHKPVSRRDLLQLLQRLSLNQAG